MRFAPNLKKYLFLVAFLFVLVALPAFFVEKIRFKLIYLLNPFAKGLSQLTHKASADGPQKVLETENQFLKNQLSKLYAQLTCEQKKQNILAATVIYRDPASWASCFWIDKGEENGKNFIEKNCPVVYGKSVVGLIDYVGKRQSRVRLITDSGLKIAVRAARGHPQQVMILEHIEALIALLSAQKLPNGDPQNTIINTLHSLKSQFQKNCSTWYLAKGVIQGSGAPLWRKKRVLTGIGFNYDFADEEGPARELFSGTSIDGKISAMPLIQTGDLLITTGMDGVFPKGLMVGTVTKVFPLKEGAYTYDIQAVPTLSLIDEIQTVFIMPLLGFES